MKRTYIQPEVAVIPIQLEQIIAESDFLGRGEGSGGNTPEARDMVFDEED